MSIQSETTLDKMNVLLEAILSDFKCNDTINFRPTFILEGKKQVEKTCSKKCETVEPKDSHQDSYSTTSTTTTLPTSVSCSLNKSQEPERDPVVEDTKDRCQISPELGFVKYNRCARIQDSPLETINNNSKQADVHDDRKSLTLLKHIISKIPSPKPSGIPAFKKTVDLAVNASKVQTNGQESAQSRQKRLTSEKSPVERPKTILMRGGTPSTKVVVSRAAPSLAPAKQVPLRQVTGVPMEAPVKNPSFKPGSGTAQFKSSKENLPNRNSSIKSPVSNLQSKLPSPINSNVGQYKHKENPDVPVKKPLQMKLSNAQETFRKSSNGIDSTQRVNNGPGSTLTRTNFNRLTPTSSSLRLPSKPAALQIPKDASKLVRSSSLRVPPHTTKQGSSPEPTIETQTHVKPRPTRSLVQTGSFRSVLKSPSRKSNVMAASLVMSATKNAAKKSSISSQGVSSKYPVRPTYGLSRPKSVEPPITKGPAK